MRAADVMCAPAITVPATTPVAAAAALLASHGFTAAPVLDGERHLIGIVTEADLTRNRVRPEQWPEPARGLPGTVGEVMTRAPLVMRPEDDLADVVTLMLDAPIRSMPIVDDGVVVGVITRRDILRVVARGELTSAEVRVRRAGVTPAQRTIAANAHAGQGRVVVGIDGAGDVAPVLGHAAAEAIRRGASLSVVTAVAPPGGRPGLGGPAAPPAFELVRETEEEMHRLVGGELAEDDAGPPVQVRVRVGTPADVLADETVGADLLVVGHRRTEAGPVRLAGSVAMQCIERTRCAVVVVPVWMPEARPEPRDASSAPSGPIPDGGFA